MVSNDEQNVVYYISHQQLFSCFIGNKNKYFCDFVNNFLFFVFNIEISLSSPCNLGLFIETQPITQKKDSVAFSIS